MKDVVSFETAKRLKDAGFPQPVNVWTFGNYFYSGQNLFHGNGAGKKNSSDVFAPTATDILKELGWRYSFQFDNNPQHGSMKFMCLHLGIQNPHFHENPAEACAAAWLSIHEKTANQ